jgi:hypothetical protein
MLNFEIGKKAMYKLFLKFLINLLFNEVLMPKHQSLVSFGGRRRPADGLRQKHIHTIQLLVWNTVEDFTAILTYTWDETKDDSTFSTYACGRISTE